jgi:hypothetical protein
VLDPASETILTLPFKLKQSTGPQLIMVAFSAARFTSHRLSNLKILLGLGVTAARRTLKILEPLAGEDGPIVYRTRFGQAVVGRIPKFLVTGLTTRKAVNLESVPPTAPCMMDRTHSFQQPTGRILIIL